MGEMELYDSSDVPDVNSQLSLDVRKLWLS